MAVEKVVFYSVRCDKCNCLLEDYTGELARLIYTRDAAEKLAKTNGFVQISPRKWICPECVKKDKMCHHFPVPPMIKYRWGGEWCVS